MMNMIGQTIGQYRIEAPLDSGGMGQVFRGVHIYLDRPAAIKIMHAHLANNPKFQGRFVQEAKSAAALKHPNIVSIYEFGEQNGQLYLVMELMTDGTLRSLLQKRATGQALPLAIGLDLVRQAAEGLAAAHAQSVIHRDIKPDNLMLNRVEATGPLRNPYQLKISDFGLARLAEGSGLTATNATLGTLAYMSPEQCIGGNVDGRTDLYALGVVLYEVATGYLPFQINNFQEALQKHTHVPPPPPRQVRPDLPASLDAIILRSLAKNPNDRFATGTEMASALQSVIGSADVQPATSWVAGSTPSAPTLANTRTDKTALEAPRVGVPVPDVSTLPGISNVPRVRVLDQSGQTVKVVDISTRGLTVGRQSSNDIALSGDGVSRQHLQINWDGRQVTVKDLGSSNGTVLGDQRLLPQVNQPWEERQMVRVGPFWLRLEGARQADATALQGTAFQGTAMQPSNIPSGSATSQRQPNPTSNPGATYNGGRISVTVDPALLTITPGQSPSAIRVTLANLGNLVDWFRLSVEGVPPEWVQLPDYEVQLNPGTQETVDLGVHVARIPTNLAKEYPVTIRARSREKSSESGTARARWNVLPFKEDLLRIEPRRVVASGKAAYTVMLANGGNTFVHHELMGEDDEQKIAYTFGQNVIDLEPGREMRVPLQIGLKRRWLGREDRHPFQINSRPVGSSLPLSGSAEFVNKPLLPSWLLPAIGVALALALVLAAVTGTLPFGKQAATPTSQMGATMAPAAATATATMLANVTPTPPPSPATPQPTKAAAAAPVAPPPTPAVVMAQPVSSPSFFVQKAVATNMTGDYTIINNQLANSKPDAIIEVSQSWKATGGVFNNHPIGVWYDGTNWAIFNEDAMTLQDNALFDVHIVPASNTAFVLTATAANMNGNYTLINNPLTNNNPNAVIEVTENWNPNGQTGIYNTHNVGVWYTGSQWAIFNEDATAITLGASFNVNILGNNDASLVQTSSTANTTGNYTSIDNAFTNGNPNVVLIVTQVYNPSNGVGSYNNFPVGIWFGNNQWHIFNEYTNDATTAPLITTADPHPSFNVQVLIPHQ